MELANYSTVSVSARELPLGYSTWPRALWNDVMVKEGISMETPTLVVSIEPGPTRAKLKCRAWGRGGGGGICILTSIKMDGWGYLHSGTRVASFPEKLR